MNRYGCFYFLHSNDCKNAPLYNVDIAEIAGRLTVNKEARQGSIFRINIYREIWRKEEDRGVKRDTNNIGRNHTEGLSLSIKEKRKQRKRIGVRSAWVVFSWELEILLSSNPYPPPHFPLVLY